MNIASLKWADAEQSALIVNGGSVVTWPNAPGFIRPVIQAAIDGGMVIADYQTLDEIKVTARAVITSARNAELSALVIIYAGDTYQADSASVENLTAAVSYIQGGGVLPVGFAWRDLNNVDHVADLAFLMGLSELMMTARYTTIRKAHALKDSIQVAADALAVEAVTW